MRVLVCVRACVCACVCVSNTKIDEKGLSLIDCIAEGGFGSIFEAKWYRTRVAVKKFTVSEMIDVNATAESEGGGGPGTGAGAGNGNGNTGDGDVKPAQRRKCTEEEKQARTQEARREVR